jgi:tetratricopeptide (TPR) repeat protein
MSQGELHDREFEQLVHAFTDWATQMNRRDVLALIGAAATSAYASPLLERFNADDSERLAMAAASPSRVDDVTIGHIEAVLRHCMRQEDSLGPQATVATVLAQQNLVVSLLAAGVQEQMRSKLLSLLADIRRCTAWMMFNLNDFRGADYHYAQARNAAHQADDDAMCSMVLANWSQLATWRGDPRLGVEHALGALAWGQRAGSKLLTAYACDVGARAYAAVVRRSAKGERRKDHTRCFRSVDQAQRELHGADAGDPGARLVPFYGEGQYLSTKTGCLLDTGDPAQALQVAATAAAGIDPAFVRNVAYIKLKTAQAHLHLRDIEEACEELGEAARLAEHNTSPRLARSVVETREKLSPWHRTRSVAALDERLQGSGLIA